MEVDSRLIVTKFKEKIPREFAYQFLEYLGCETIEQRDGIHGLYAKCRIIHVRATSKEKKQEIIEELKKYDKFIENIIDPYDYL